MNKVILMGRLTRDPDVRYTQGSAPMCIARYTLAVDRRFSRNNNDGNNADFIPCVVFGKSAEFTEKYLRKGTKMAIVGRIQTGSYTNKDGVKVYTTEVVVEDQEFAESRNAAQGNAGFSGNGGYNGNSGYNGNGNNSGYNSGAAQAHESGASDNSSANAASDSLDGFMNIPDALDESLPFM